MIKQYREIDDNNEALRATKRPIKRDEVQCKYCWEYMIDFADYDQHVKDCDEFETYSAIFREKKAIDKSDHMQMQEDGQLRLTIDQILNHGVPAEDQSDSRTHDSGPNMSDFNEMSQDEQDNDDAQMRDSAVDKVFNILLDQPTNTPINTSTPQPIGHQTPDLPTLRESASVPTQLPSSPLRSTNISQNQGASRNEVARRHYEKSPTDADDVRMPNIIDPLTSFHQRFNVNHAINAFNNTVMDCSNIKGADIMISQFLFQS